jgi:hypothetical protein
MNNQIAIIDRLTEMPGLLKQLENGILAGEINPLEMKLVEYGLTKWLEYVKKNETLQGAVMMQAQNNEKNFEYRGIKMQIAEAGVSYDYSPCEDSRLEYLNAEIEQLTEQKKAIEKELQARVHIKDFINPVTGEIIEVKKPIKSSKTIVKIVK